VLLANSQATLSQHSKHLEIKDLKIRELVESGIIDVIYCRTRQQVAGPMTKNLNSTAFPKFAAFVCGYVSHNHVIMAIFKNLNSTAFPKFAAFVHGYVSHYHLIMAIFKDMH